MSDTNTRERFGFSVTLRAQRYQRNLTQKEVAKLAGVPYNTYRAYEYDRTVPTLETVRKIAIVLNVSVDYLLELSTESAPDKSRKDCIGEKEWKQVRMRLKKAKERQVSEEWMRKLTTEVTPPENRHPPEDF